MSNQLVNQLVAQSNRVKTLDESLARLAGDISLIAYSPQQIDVPTEKQKKKSTIYETFAVKYAHDKGWGPYFEGKILLQKNDTSRALQLFTKGLRHINDENDRALFYSAMGDAYYKQDRYKEAIVKYKEALLVKPEDDITLNSLGNSYYRRSLTEDEKETKLELLSKAYDIF